VSRRKVESSLCRHCAATVYPKPAWDGPKGTVLYRLCDADGKEHRCPEGAKERGEAHT
jgi:hypothetical protein